MPWYLNIPWSESIKKRACRYLLQRYLGQFLEEKLTLDQLTVDLYNGKGTVCDVSLDVQALNELAEQQCMPVWFASGSLASVSVSIPWSALLTEASYVEVTGLRIVVRPKQRAENCTSMLESMWNSLSSSMQLAEECLKQEAEQDLGTPLEGLELFAQTIDSILSRVKVRFLDSAVRLEHVPQGSPAGVALELRIRDMTYLDEAGMDSPDAENEAGGYQVSAFTTKKFSLEGVTFYTDEFSVAPLDTFMSSVTSMSQADTEGVLEKTEKEPEHDPILIARLAARQEVRLKLKQSENIQGPKVSLDAMFGSLTCFLSPRQLHILGELASGLASPATQDNESTLGNQGRCSQKPMQARDFQLVEHDLQQRLRPTPNPSHSLQPNQGWSGGNFQGDSEEEDEFLPMSGRSRTGAMSASVTSSVSSLGSSMTASSISSASTFQQKSMGLGLSGDSSCGHKKKSRRAAEEEAWCSDTTYFTVRLSSLAVVVLQEDLLVPSPTPSVPTTTPTPRLTPSSIQQMKTASLEFFSRLGIFAATGFGHKDFEQAREIFSKACQVNHLRLLAVPVVVEGTERTGSSGSATEGCLTAARLEIRECLPEQPGQDSDLLKFTHQSDGPSLSSIPDLQLSFSHSERPGRLKQSSGSIMAQPRSQFKVQLQRCLMEVDLSLMDRISAILNQQSLCQPVIHRPSTMSQQLCFYQAAENPALSESRVDLRFICPYLSIKLRFPCPDLRPLSDMTRSPWWRRLVRPDWLLLELQEATLSTLLDSRDPALRLEVTCRELQVLYQEGDQEPTIPILGSQADEPGQSLPNGGEGFGWSSLVLVINPSNSSGQLTDVQDFEDSEESMGQSSLDTLEREIRAKEPSPFSAKRVVHESDTPHEMQGETDELVIPGDKKEMAEFIEFATRQSRIHVELCLPRATLTLPSKHLYELVYNRITTDLMLWEPARPSPATPAGAESPFMSGVPLGLADMHLMQSQPPMAFSMCKSGIQLDSDSESSSDSEGIFYSVHEHRQRQKLQNLRQPRPPSGQSNVTVSLTVGQGTITMCTPVRDSMGCVIPSQRGEIQLGLVEGSLFAVSGHRGNPNLGYVCVQSNQASLYHLGLLPAESEGTPLLPTITQTGPGANLKPLDPVGCGPQSLDMLSIAVRIQLDQPASLKLIRVAAGVRGGTLQHRVVPGPQSWLSQLLDVLDVQDEPVPGYSPPRVITELHLHLWDCAVDYKPLHLPLRSMLTMGSFSISSNLAAQTRSSSLRFIAEEGALFLCDTNRARHSSPELRKDYVCVMDLGLFELSLRLSDDPRAPKVDLRASSTALNMRTCADSCQALANLLTYFASDGDLQPSPVVLQSSGSSGGGFQPSAMEQQPPLGSALAQFQAEHVHNMMEEAMKDSGNGHSLGGKTSHREKSPANAGQAEEVFYFPDDGQLGGGVSASRQPSNAQGVLSDDEEEFCILGEDPGTGIMPASGEAEVRRLVQGPVRVVDNHFTIPLGRTDLLEAPRHFPNPELRYTLCDLSLTWHLYGGSDFAPRPLDSATPKKHVRISSTERTEGGSTPLGTRRASMGQPSISFSKANPQEVRFGSVPPISSPNRRPSSATSQSQLTWQSKGGPGRDLDTLMELQLNKVRFRHEVYPEEAEVASRQVLLVQGLEVRDRLASSSINKFLYQYCSEAHPRQAHANMVVIKALHVRPDPSLPGQQECCLRVSLLPLRLNIDQDALLFLYTFFVELGATNHGTEEEEGPRLTPTHQLPVMSVKGVASGDITSSPSHSTHSSHSDRSVEDSLDKPLLPPLQLDGISDDGAKNSPPIFFRSLLFSPDVPIRVDYQGKRVDMTHGPLAGILMGLAQLNCSELRLKRLSYRHGLLGFDKLISFVMGEWLSDIKKNQLPSLLGGVGPMHSFVQLFQGLRDLVLLPIEQYQRDGRIVRGLQRGAQSFTSSTAMAALELTNRLVHAVQITAETAYDMLSPGPSVRQRRILGCGHQRRRRRYNQPADIREGVANAYQLVQEGLGDTARTLVAVASAEHEEKGMYGAVGGVLRQIPPTVVTPILLASEATASVLGGVRSQLAPDVRREAAQKWRHNDAA